jgi:hypothetical protein
MRIRAGVFIGVAIIGFALGGGAISARADDFFDLIMQVLGISATPSQMKGDSNVSAGQVWITDVERGTRAALTTDSGYRWPVYEPGGQAIVALEGDSLVRIPTRNGKINVLQKIPSVEKLVGFDRKDPDKLLVILDRDTVPLALLSLKTGNLTPLPYDPKSKEHRRMLSHVKGEERVYGSARVYVKTEVKRGMEGGLEWSEVYLQEGEATPLNVSKGDGVDCGQPSLSPDRNAVVYVRASGSG